MPARDAWLPSLLRELAEVAVREPKHRGRQIYRRPSEKALECGFAIPCSEPSEARDATEVKVCPPIFRVCRRVVVQLLERLGRAPDEDEHRG